jgi:histidyl-tRNA synthetase
MKKDIKQSIKGARDFYPQELAIRNWLFAKWREVARSFGYEEIDGPNIESFDLFASKSGEELVNQQMYTLEDRDGNKLGIRPEITPTYARMVAKKQGELIFPLKWMMFGEVWRYEKPQTGRSRDFWQWELNLVGGTETMSDAEVLVVAAKAIEAVGITPDDVVLRINDRRFMQQKLGSFGIEGQTYETVRKIIDKKEKISDEDFTSLLNNAGLKTDQIDKLKSFLDNPDYSEYEPLVKLFKILDKYGVSDFVKFDPIIVRGITYYTGLVFECFDNNKELRSIFGGGRFDDLVETFGGGKIPAVGFAIGDVVITELLKRLGKLPVFESSPTKILTTVFSSELLDDSIELTKKLRDSGINTEIYPDSTAKLEKQLKYADKKGIPYVVIIGPEEIKENKVVLKNLRTKEQTKTSLENLISLVK